MINSVYPTIKAEILQQEWRHMGEAEKLLPLRVTVWTASSRQLTPLCSLGSRSMAWSRNNRMSLCISCRVMDNNRQEARKMEVSVAAAHGNLIVLRFKHLNTTARASYSWVLSSNLSSVDHIYYQNFPVFLHFYRMNPEIVPYNSPTTQCLTTAR